MEENNIFFVFVSGWIGKKRAKTKNHREEEFKVVVFGSR